MNICDGIFYSENKSTLIHFAYTECKWNGLVTLNLADSEKVTKIANQACANSSIQRLVLGKNILTIGEKSFSNCRELQIVKYADKNEADKSRIDNCFTELKNGDFLSVQYQSFAECSKLHTVVFPVITEKSRIRIEKDAFLNCCELRSVVLPGNGNIEISEEAFYGCDTAKLIFVCTTDSVVEQFARKNGYRCVNVQ